MFLSDVSIKRPVFATMMMVALVVLGIVSYQRLAIDEYPDITYPVVIVADDVSGRVARGDEREVSRPIEEALNTVQGIKEITSTSLEGISIVRLQFNLGVDVDGGAAGRAGEGRAHPARSCRRTSTSRSSGTSIRTTRRSCRSRCRATERPHPRAHRPGRRGRSPTRLEAIPGVGGVNVVGGNERVRSACSSIPTRMRAYGVSPPQVIAGAAAREPGSAGRPRRARRRPSGSCASPAASSIRARSPTSSSPCATACRCASATSPRSSTAPRSGAPRAEHRRHAARVSLEVLKISGANTVEVADCGARRRRRARSASCRPTSS